MQTAIFPSDNMKYKMNYVARKDIIFESSHIVSFIYNLLIENFELLCIETKFN